uniref:UPF0676 protein C1494.01-like n=1 Tax=Saccoglossus kowalevskii TaxID=10224 RepID=A0ABM0MQG4_SACKO|nr:PREDICTED: UPF0676 protein C1494.01-like [Saccoglossus kowalevskii]
MKYDMATLSKYGYVHGYVRMEAERSDTVVPHGDLKECFNYLHNIEPDSFTSDTDVVADFKATMSDFYKSCAELSQRLLEIIGRGLELEDPRIFLKAHDGIIGGDNRSVLRTLYYPALEGDHPVKNGQTRCGEHSDYGSLTLLFQDEVGGLQVMSSSGEFVDATPIEGTIIVNIGDLMQRWTSDKLVSTRHRVLVPSSVDKKRKTRQSIAFFANPNCKHLITPVDACDKYPPITVADFLKMKLDSTY